MFVTGEYTIPDFRFLNMLMSLIFEALYPPPDVLLNNVNLLDDNKGFLIHRGFFDKICRILLRIERFPKQNLENIVKNMNISPEYPDLLPVWFFAREMVSLFADCHIRFHQQIRNIFHIIGGTDPDYMSRETFPDFVKIVNPELRDTKIRSMWQTMVLLDTGKDQLSVPLEVFVKFCGDYPGMSRWIGELPYLETFQSVYGEMSDSIRMFFAFLLKRFTHYLPRFMGHLTSDVQVGLIPYLRKMRNGFLLCDISTCCMCYRYIMQYVDLKLSQQNPFQTITPRITIEEVSNMIAHMMMRETLGSLLLKENELANLIAIDRHI
jgi:hypothetical protein